MSSPNIAAAVARVHVAPGQLACQDRVRGYLRQPAQLGLAHVGMDEDPACVGGPDGALNSGGNANTLGFRLERRPVLTPTTCTYCGWNRPSSPRNGNRFSP